VPPSGQSACIGPVACADLGCGASGSPDAEAGDPGARAQRVGCVADPHGGGPGVAHPPPLVHRPAPLYVTAALMAGMGTS
jgi:hypothetical protein